MNAFTFPIPRGTSLGLRPIEDVMMVGAGIGPATIYAEVAKVIDRHGPGHPPTGMLQLALENLLRERIVNLEKRAEVAEAQAEAARKFGTAMLTFCSPAGVATDYGQRLLADMDRAGRS